jgi:HD-GYP domain-containing protein (c-di-GMP phosphodiesterase class II)
MSASPVDARAEGPRASGLRLAELVSGLCVVSDLGKGLSDGQGLRSCALAMDLAVPLGLDEADRTTLFWVALLRFVGCTTTATEMSVLGDEIAVSRAFASADTHNLRDVASRARSVVGSRPDRFVGFLARAPRTIHEHETTSCEVARSVAVQLDLGDDVVAGLGQVFERHDGHGNPGLRAGPLHPAVALWQVAHFVDLAAREGLDAAAELRRRAGSAFDPDTARAVAGLLEGLVLPEGGTVAEVLAREPGEPRRVATDEIESVLETFTILADGKSPYFAGHSRRVAELAGGACEAAGLPAESVILARHAGLVHDIGKVAVSSRVWNSPRPLSDAEQEQVRLHAYYTHRVLARVSALDNLVDAASAHHERLDGGGYPRGLTTFSPVAAIVAAADCFVTAGEPRPYRAARSAAEQAALLEDHAAAGRLPSDAVEAVLRAATGDRTPAQTAGDLTAREREVLELVAHGMTNQAIGRRLGISAKTVNTHLEHSYAKLGVSTRVAAVVHATRRGWIAP